MHNTLFRKNTDRFSFYHSIQTPLTFNPQKGLYIKVYSLFYNVVCIFQYQEHSHHV